MNINRYLTGAVLVWGCLSNALSGAEFRALSWEGTLEDVTFAGLPRKEKLTIYDGGFTSWQKIKVGALPVDFFQGPETPIQDEFGATPLPEASAKAKPEKPKVFAQVAWPAGVNRALLLFTRAPAGSPMPYKVVVIPDRESNAVPPAIRLFNYSTGPVVAQLGQGAPLQMEPRQIHEEDELPANGAKKLKLAYRKGNAWKIAANQNLAIPPGFVTYIFVSNTAPNESDPNTPTVGFKLLYDQLPAVTADPNATANK